jgi:hypothetical protein
MKLYNKYGELVGILNENDEFVEITDIEEYKETFDNLLKELERIAEAVRKFGGAWYSKKNEYPPSHITDLVVTHNGCIAAAGYNSYYYSINSIYLDNDGFPIVSEWSCDGSLSGSDDPAVMLDSKIWSNPAFMVYSIKTGEYTIRNKVGMLEMYQRTLDNDSSIAPVSSMNSRYRIGGKYFDLSFDEYIEALRKENEEVKKMRATSKTER